MNDTIGLLFPGNYIAGHQVRNTPCQDDPTLSRRIDGPLSCSTEEMQVDLILFTSCFFPFDGSWHSLTAIRKSKTACLLAFYVSRKKHVPAKFPSILLQFSKMKTCKLIIRIAAQSNIREFSKDRKGYTKRIRCVSTRGDCEGLDNHKNPRWRHFIELP